MGNFHYRLLVIDDEPLSRELFQRSLSRKVMRSASQGTVLRHWRKCAERYQT
jgi:CheY-like chemotaxis protein